MPKQVIRTRLHFRTRGGVGLRFCGWQWTDTYVPYTTVNFSIRFRDSCQIVRNLISRDFLQCVQAGVAPAAINEIVHCQVVHTVTIFTIFIGFDMLKLLLIHLWSLKLNSSQSQTSLTLDLRVPVSIHLTWEESSPFGVNLISVTFILSNIFVEESFFESSTLQKTFFTSCTWNRIQNTDRNSAAFARNRTYHEFASD